MPLTIPTAAIDAQVRAALEEDIGSGDVTAELIPEDSVREARVITREAAVLCGQAWFDSVFRQLDDRIAVTWHSADGAEVEPDAVLCTVRGPARPILSGERTALNFLQLLSGTATQTRRYVRAVADTGARVLDTRKTLPGLRLAQKYAVGCGGGTNHRLGLYDAILIKENHIQAAGSISAAIHTARRSHPELSVEVEVEDFDEIRAALDAGADRLLLDNMTLADLRRAVALVAGRAELEASGGVTLDNIRAIAETGVDFISIGALTKHVQAIDLSMRFIPASSADIY